MTSSSRHQTKWQQPPDWVKAQVIAERMIDRHGSITAAMAVCLDVMAQGLDQSAEAKYGRVLHILQQREGGGGKYAR